MQHVQLYPLKFEPVYQYRIWGGRRLSNLLSKPLPRNEPVGEAWILSDRDDQPSRVAEGSLKGKKIKWLMKHEPEHLMGKFAGKFERFPLLLKFLDCKEVLSVQVHPSDELTQYIPKGESGKTEAWVVLQTGKDAIIYAGLKQGTTPGELSDSVAANKVADDLAHFKPVEGDCVLINAGTVHTLGDVVVFEVQQNSDVTFRLYDWDRIDRKTGKPRPLQVEEAMACIDFDRTDVKKIVPVVKTDVPDLSEVLIQNEHFQLCRITGAYPFLVGKADEPRVLICIDGGGDLEYSSDIYPVKKGEVILLPASVGSCPVVPNGKISLLELALPQ
jgi:mannose-6-phosphate isomerase